MATCIGRPMRTRAATLLLCLLAGCAGIEVRRPGGEVERMDKEAFKAYVRGVFHRQNRATDEVIAALDGGGVLTALEDAEEAMQLACEPLIDLVQARVARKPLPLEKKLEMPEAAPRCEAAVAKVEALLR
ncbi:MAG: hypothetical protein AB7I01_08335 [Gammaproteobacteria bacterium]